MRKEKKTIAKPEKDESLEAEQSKDFSTALVESSFETSFFYTNDKFIRQLDDNEIFSAIQAKYSMINETTEDTVLRKQIIAMLDDNDFICSILVFFNMTIYDLFKLLYSKFSSLFKGSYLKKVKSTIDGKAYALATRKKHDY